MILVFAANYERACNHFAGPPKHKWRYVQTIKDVIGLTDIEILDLGDWESDLKKIEAWDLVHILRKE